MPITSFTQFIQEMATWRNQYPSYNQHDSFEDRMIDNWELPHHYGAKGEFGYREPHFDTDLAQAYIKTRYPHWYKRSGGVSVRTLPPSHPDDTTGTGIWGLHRDLPRGTTRASIYIHNTQHKPGQRAGTIAHELLHDRDSVKGKPFTDYDKPHGERPHEIRANQAGDTAERDFNEFYRRTEDHAYDSGYYGGIRQYFAKKLDQKYGAGTYEKTYLRNKGNKALLNKHGWEEQPKQHDDSPHRHVFRHPKHGTIVMNDEGDIEHYTNQHRGPQEPIRLNRFYGIPGQHKSAAQYLRDLGQ